MPSANLSPKPTSLKLPPGLKAQLEDVAQNAGLSLHAFMIQTLADSVRRAQMREAFAQDSIDALRDMKTNGLGYELGDVRTYFSQLAEHRKGKREKPAAPKPTRIR